MQFTTIKHEGNTTTMTGVEMNNPLGYLWGIILSAGICLLGIAFTIFTILNYIQYLKIREYPELEGTIINKTMDGEVEKYTVAYNIDGQNYTYDNVFMTDKEIGDTIKICYNPKDYHDIYWGDKEVHPLLPFLAFFFDAVGVSAIVRNIKKLLHFINPSKYEDVADDNVSTSIAFGDGGFKTDPFSDTRTDGTHTEMRF